MIGASMPSYTPEDPAFSLIGEHPAERVFNAQARSSDVYLHGETPPSRNQTAAVLHALADHTHQVHMLGPAVRALGADRADMGEAWVATTGLGRYFHALGDWLEDFGPATRLPNAEEIEERLRFVMANRCLSCLRPRAHDAADRLDSWFCPTSSDETCVTAPRDGLTADRIRAEAIENLMRSGVPVEGRKGTLLH